MLKVTVELRNRVDVAKLQADTLGRIDLATARAADLIAAALGRFSGDSEGLKRRTGMLARTWTVSRRAPGEYLARNPSVYAAIHEYGGEVVPTKAQALAIPIGEGLTDRGVARYPSPRDVGGLFAFTSRKGNVLLAKSLGRGRLELYYVLKPRVEIPARHYATRAVESAKDAAVEEILRALKK